MITVISILLRSILPYITMEDITWFPDSRTTIANYMRHVFFKVELKCCLNFHSSDLSMSSCILLSLSNGHAVLL